MDSKMAPLTAAGAIASVIIEPENWRMMASSRLLAGYFIGFSKPRTGRMVALSGMGR
jgi:hypothetical protein